MLAALAVVIGAGLYTLALPPYDHATLGWVALVPLLLAVRGRSTRTGFALGLLYGFVFGWGVTGWSLQAVRHYFAFPLPLALAGLTIFYVAIFVPNFGLFGAGVARLMRSRRGWSFWIGVPALWAAAEFIRGRFVAQPWGLLAYSQHSQLGLIQITTLTGVYGLSFLLALGNLAIAECLMTLRERRTLRPLVRPLLIPAMFIASVWIVGSVALDHSEVASPNDRSVAIVQTNVPPAYRWTRPFADRLLLDHVMATEGLPASERPALIVWPEHAVAEYVESDPLLASRLAELAHRHGADLLFGAPRYEAGHTYNSIRLITAQGRNGGYYDKRHLVLFAEGGLLTGPASSHLSESPSEFSAGKKPGVLTSFVPLGTSICHEIVYPELVADSVRSGAQLLVNVSNDGWLDAGSGVASQQHFAMATLRAVESRRYLVRAATTGVSGVIDPFGRVVATVPPNTAGTVTATVSGRAELTPYILYGDVFAYLCSLLAVLAVAAHRLRIVATRPLHRRTGPLVAPAAASFGWRRPPATR